MKSAKLGFWTAVALVVGNMIGSGIFLLPASLAPYGALSLAAWVFTGTGAVLLALVFARLARVMPATGGPYAYTRATFGEFAGFLVAWGYWIALWAGNAAIAVALAGYLGVFFPALSSQPALGALAAIGAVWVLSAVNAWGVRQVGWVQSVTTVLKLIPLAAIIVVGVFYVDLSFFTVPDTVAATPFASLTAAAALTLWAFLGLESATVPAGDVADAERTIPRATVIGTVLAAVIYVLSTGVVLGLLPPAEVASSTAPFADAAAKLWGDWGRWLVAAGAVVSCFGTLNGWTLLTAQVPMAAADDGLFPALFGRRSGRGTPVAGLLLSTVLITLVVASNYSKGLVSMFTFVILLSTLATLIPYLFCAAGLLFLPQNQRGRGAVVLSLAAFAYALWAVAGSGQESVFWGFLLWMAGLPVYVALRLRQRRAEQV